MSEEVSERKMFSSNAPTSFTDGVNIACREDGGVLLEFISETPDRFIENHRTLMTKDGIILFIDNLANALDYFPVKSSEEETK